MIVPVKSFIKIRPMFSKLSPNWPAHYRRRQPALMELFDRLFERGLSEVDLSKSAPELNLRDVGHVFRHRDLAVHLAAFDRQLLQYVCVPVRIDDLPMRIGSVGS